MISFDQVTKKFSIGDPVLQDITFAIQPQELVVFHGPSGSGKTTLFRLMIRDLTPTSGNVSVNDLDLNSLPTSRIPNLRRQVGVAFQDFKVIPDKTVYENIALGLQIHGLKDKAISSRVQELLDLVGLPHKSQLFPVQLSGGELQRVAIARALAPEPSILLADEPTGNLDSDTAWQIIELLQQINKLGTTVLIATHNPEIIKDLKARKIHLNKGVLENDTHPNPQKDSKDSKKSKKTTDDSSAKEETETKDDKEKLQQLDDQKE